MASNFLDYFKTYVSNLPATGIAKVYFDIDWIINTANVKTYPYVFWHVGTISGTDNFRTGNKKIKITCYVIDEWISEEETTITKEKQWDLLRDYFDVYLAKLETLESSYKCVITSKDMSFDVLDRGMTTDEDLAIAYKDIEVDIFC